MSPRVSIKKILADIKEFLIPYYVQLWIYPRKVLTYRRRIRDIRKRGEANVVFIASVLAMWKYQRIYELLCKDSRFNTTIIIAPFYSYGQEQQNHCMQELALFFSQKNIPFIDSREIKDLGRWLEEEIKPDLIFYPQPYEWLFLNELDWTYHPTSLIAYVPYGVQTILQKWTYNSRFDYNAWRLYYLSAYNKENARKLSFCRGKNVRVSGYVSYDELTLCDLPDVWKPQQKRKKRIIWAPHFSGMRQPNWLNRGAFKWLWKFMQDLAISHKDTIQIAFKPHPRLLSALYDTPEWGKEKADAYYDWWASGENTQLETGQFYALFKYSDAMIHDCDSFMGDYLLTGKPVLFTSDNLEETEAQLDDFGKAALHSHYIGRDVQDILSFVENIEADGPDPKATDREQAYQKYLLPPNGVSAAENIYNDIVKSIRF